MRVSRIKLSSGISEPGLDVDLLLIDPVIERYKGKQGNLIPLLQGAQNIYGYIPKSVFDKISSETGLKKNDLYGVATFYAQFRLKPVGKVVVRVCHGTACHVQNATKITEDIQTFLNVKDGETTEDRLFTLESVACLGCCSLAPCMMIGDETFGKLNGKKAVEVVKNIKRKETLDNKPNQSKPELWKT
ncbi:MAG: NADH-quinone oxidoreductase subunit NuoE [Ignavibacteriaceae bacterium]|nr:NADH-quinone oxidoreductase subunit NuoE [Ignavibacteriaceae bacterium]